MIFSIDFLNVSEKIVIDSSINSFAMKTYCGSNDMELLGALTKLHDLSEDEFIETLEKYDGGQFYGIRKDIFLETMVGSHSVESFLTAIDNFFTKMTSRGVYEGEKRELLKVFYSCFFISKETIKEYAKEVEKSLKGLEDSLSFIEYVEAYENELKNLIENYQLIRS